MNCFGKRSRRTAPLDDGGGNVAPPYRSKMTKRSCRFQVTQTIGWLMFSHFTIVSFGIFIPLLPQPWNYVCYALLGAAFVLHLMTHLGTVVIDAGVRGMRAKQNYSKRERREQSSVSQTMHCTLCDVTVGPKVKHCTICNKCIKDFRHHCSLMNTCVGGRNYSCFLVALSSATFGTLLVLVVTLVIVIQYFLDPGNLRTDPGYTGIKIADTWLVFLPLAPMEISGAGLLVICFITIVLSALILLMLAYLMGLHLYISVKGWTMYEYVMMHRLRGGRKQDIEAPKSSDANRQTKREASAPQVTTGREQNTCSICLGQLNK